jgi:choline dehydrogenase-like flavoprotein
MSTSHKTAVIIGSGFGGSMAGLCLADEFKKRGRGETILMLERGTWWTTPVSTVQDKEVATYDFLVRKQQPVQHWSSQNHFRGAVDLLTRCYRRPGNEDGLYDFTTLGKPGFLGLFGRDSDGVSILRASGVGGGSLVYSNVTIGPPDSVLEDPRWPLTWTAGERNSYWAADRIIADHRARRPFGSGRTPVSARCYGRATGSSPCGVDTTAQRCGLSHSMGLPQALCIPSRAASARGTAIRVEAQTG